MEGYKMAMSINTNAGAEFAAIAAQRAAEMMDEAMLRLSTGKRINSAKDDAAGMAVATRMAKEIAGLGQALRNANDAQGLIDTGEAALEGSAYPSSSYAGDSSFGIE